MCQSNLKKHERIEPCYLWFSIFVGASVFIHFLNVPCFFTFSFLSNSLNTFLLGSIAKNKHITCLYVLHLYIANHVDDWHRTYTIIFSCYLFNELNDVEQYQCKYQFGTQIIDIPVILFKHIWICWTKFNHDFMCSRMREWKKERKKD